MINIPKARLLELKKNFKNKKIAVIGDMMLDCYFWGEVKRISPEAPVPIVEIDNEFYRFGGAANVAYNIIKLGGVPIPIGVIGDDSFGRIFSSLIEDAKIISSGLLVDPSRPTTTKSRVISDNQQIVRIDREKKDYLTKEVQTRLLNYIEKIIDDVDGIILQDYNKGVLTPQIIQKVISIGNKKKILITVDPKFNNFFKYKNVTVFKPNRKEASDALGMKIKSQVEIELAGKKLLSKLNSKFVLMTLGEEGIAVFEKGKKEKTMPTKASKVADVSGAGDTVISTLTMALASNANIYEACFLANYAGGIVCEEAGIVPIEIDNLFNTILKDGK